MALTSSEVRVAVSGELHFGLTSATAPTSTSAALTGFTGTGYISEDGVVENSEVTREQLRAWQNSATVRETVTEARQLYTFTLIQTNKANTELFYGATVTQTTAHGTYTISAAATAGRKSWVLDVVDGAQVKRIYVAEGELFKGGEISYANGAAIGYPCELVAYTDPVVYDTALKSVA